MEINVKKFDELTVDELYEIIKVRIEVFAVEQQCVYQDLDDRDKRAYHIYITEDNKIKAYLRLMEPGVVFEEPTIGRVLTTERGRGFAKMILLEAQNVVKERMGENKIRLEAQSYVRKMYESLGYVQVSEEFLEDGIPHIQMLLQM